MSFAEVNGIDLHYEIRGTGQRVLFINGIGADLKNPVGAFTSPLVDNFTVLSFDPPGLGESASFPGPFSIADLADAAAGLAKAVGWDSCLVFGASMGGMVAQELVLRYPHLVDRLVIGVTNWGGTAIRGNRALDRLGEMSAEERLTLSDTRKDSAWMEANPEAVRQAEEGFQIFIESLKTDPKKLQAYNYQARASQEHDTFDRLPEINAPTLVFGGLYDGSNPPEITKKLAGKIPGARCELVESGHGDWFFDPKVWQMIAEFFNG